MQTVNEVINQTMITVQQSSEQPQIQTGTTEAANNIADEIIVNVNRIFTTLRVSFPAWYSKHYSNPKTERAAKTTWLTGIKELSTDQVRRGLQQLPLCEFPPNLFEFVKLCKQVKGLPDLDTAFNQALAGKFKLNKIHDVVKVAANKTGIFDLLHGSTTDSELKKRFAYNYHIIVDRFAKGEPLNGEVNRALEHLVSSPTKGVNDDLIEQGIQTQRASGKSGYEAFLELKRKRSNASQ